MASDSSCSTRNKKRQKKRTIKEEDLPPITCPECHKGTEVSPTVYLITYFDPHFNCRKCGYSGNLHWHRDKGGTQEVRRRTKK